MLNTKGRQLDKTHIVMSDLELKRFRDLIAKDERTDEEWDYVNDILEHRNVIMLTYLDKWNKGITSLEAFYTDNDGVILVFTSTDGCSDYAQRISNNANFGMAVLTFHEVVGLANYYERRVIVDINHPVRNHCLGYDGKDNKIRVYIRE